MAKLGRKAQHFTTTGGDVIPGLIHQKDGRWRILASGKRFTAGTEAEAVATFYRLAGRDTVAVPSQSMIEQDDRGSVWMRTETPGEAYWPWLREQLITNIHVVAKKTGLPGLAALDLTAIPGKAITLKEIADLYVEKSESKQNTRGHVASAMRKLATITGASNLAELTTPALMQFREVITKELRPTGAAAIFGKVKSAIAFGTRWGWTPSRSTPRLPG